MAEPEAPQEIRCECSRTPLLARAGIEDGKPFLWVRHTKSGRPIIDARFESGTAKLVCRECRRVTTIQLRERMEISRR